VSALTGATLRVRGAIRLCALCGIAGQIVLTVGWVVGDILQPAAYSASRQEISDLGALTAAHAWVWNAPDSLSGALTAIFALGLFALPRGDRAGRLGAALVGVSGLGDLLDGFVREDCPLSASRACRALREGPGLSWHHQVHDLESVIAGFAAILAPSLLAHAFARLAPWRSPLRVHAGDRHCRAGHDGGLSRAVREGWRGHPAARGDHHPRGLARRARRADAFARQPPA
jgi:hypothetical protein